MDGKLYEKWRYGENPSHEGYLLQIGHLSVVFTNDKVYPHFYRNVTKETFITDVTIPDEIYNNLLGLAQSRAKYEEKIKLALL
ncbi:MAG: hypothetical protein ACK5UY_01035 [Holosporales bacterium]